MTFTCSNQDALLKSFSNFSLQIICLNVIFFSFNILKSICWQITLQLIWPATFDVMYDGSTGFRLHVLTNQVWTCSELRISWAIFGVHRLQYTVTLYTNSALKLLSRYERYPVGLCTDLRVNASTAQHIQNQTGPLLWKSFVPYKYLLRIVLMKQW